MKDKKNKKNKKASASLTILFSVIVFFILLAAVGLAALSAYIFVKTGVIGRIDEALNTYDIIVAMLIISIVLGAVIAFFGSRIPLSPFDSLIAKINRLAAGDFEARLHFKGPLASYPAMEEVEQSFNKLAEELQNTEMLRSDFINNFSHEFKTPIVSITGLAKLLNKGDLTEEERKQYLKAIEEESVRLSYMATNVLNLTKIENQSILSGVTSFNLSEQIRTSVLLLESKWSKKNAELIIDFDEFFIEANEELLKQVWINLIDNAIKFVSDGGEIRIDVLDIGDRLLISVSNTGIEIPPEKQKKIFGKFYQADESHTAEGNGIGLAIVKKIVDLHNGMVGVRSEDGRTTFNVELPKAQLLIEQRREK